VSFSSVATRGVATETGSDTSISVSPSSNILVGEIAVVLCSTQKITNTDGATSNHSIADSKGNVWNKVAEYTNTNAGNTYGVCNSIYWSDITTQISTGDTITLTTTSSVAHKIIQVIKASIGAGKTVATETFGYSLSGISASVGAFTSRSYWLVGFIATNNNESTKVPDADYSELYDTRTSSSLLESTVTNHVVSRIATLTSDTCTSSDWNNAANPVAILVPFYEINEPTTAPPTTLAPTTLAPTTLAPTTLAPTTIAITTGLIITTLEPTTPAPTSLAPTTLEPTTLAPTTLEPTTIAPTTLAPTSLAPSTLIPSTLAPSTIAPTTLSPTTLAPTTLAPTTLLPTTLAPSLARLVGGKLVNESILFGRLVQ